MGVVAWWVEGWIHGLLPGTDLWSRLWRVAGAILAAFGSLGAMAALLGIEEFTTAVRRIGGRFRG